MSHKGVDGGGRYGNKVGNSLRNKRRTDGGGRGCKPKGAYKEVPRPSRRLGLATTKSSLTNGKIKIGKFDFITVLSKTLNKLIAIVNKLSPLIKATPISITAFGINGQTIYNLLKLLV